MHERLRCVVRRYLGLLRSHVLPSDCVQGRPLRRTSAAGRARSGEILRPTLRAGHWRDRPSGDDVASGRARHPLGPGVHVRRRRMERGERALPRGERLRVLARSDRSILFATGSATTLYQRVAEDWSERPLFAEGGAPLSPTRAQIMDGANDLPSFVLSNDGDAAMILPVDDRLQLGFVTAIGKDLGANSASCATYCSGGGAAPA